MSGQTFCLDIGEGYIKLADVEAKKKNFVAKTAAFNETKVNIYSVTSQEYSAKTSEMIRVLVTDSQVKKTDVNIIIPDSQSYTRILEMPLLTDKELVSAIRYQADQFIPIPIDQVSLDIHIINKDKERNKTDILLVAAPHTVINHVVKLVEDAALMPMNIENETSAVLRLIASLTEMQPADDTAIYVNFGNSSSSIYLYDRAINRPLQVHNFSIGKQIFYKDIKANYTLNDDQIRELIENVGFTDAASQYNLHQVLASPLNEFLSEVQRFIMSSKEQVTTDIKQIFILGEGSKFAGITDKMQETIGLPVSLLNMNESFKKSNVSEFFKDDWPLLVPAVGGSLL